MKDLVKYVVSATAIVLVSPVYLLFLVSALAGDRNAAFSAASQWLSLIPGKSGSYLRVAFFRLSMAECAPDVVISFGALFSQLDTTIESGAYIGPQCNIGSSHIGRDCLLGSGVHVLSGKHQHALDRLDVPVREQGGNFVKVRLGEDCWIGNGAIIMADVGKHCVVGAGSVVVHPVSDYDIVSGNPAVVVRSRRPPPAADHVST